MEYNATKLDKELRDAGIPIDGCASDGRVDFKDEATEEHKALAETVKTNHDPTPPPPPKELYAKIVGINNQVEFIAKHLGLL